MRNSRRVLSSIEDRNGLLLIRVYADDGDEFELVDWTVSPAPAAANLARAGGPPLSVAGADGIDGGRRRPGRASKL